MKLKEQIESMPDKKEVTIKVNRQFFPGQTLSVRAINDIKKRCFHPWGSDLNTHMEKHPDMYCMGMFYYYPQILEIL